MGGSRRPSTSSPANGVLVCGTGTTGCHGYIESHRREGLARGFIVPQHEEPTEVRLIDYAGQAWRLDDAGDALPVVSRNVRHPAGEER